MYQTGSKVLLGGNKKEKYIFFNKGFQCKNAFCISFFVGLDLLTQLVVDYENVFSLAFTNESKW